MKTKMTKATKTTATAEASTNQTEKAAANPWKAKQKNPTAKRNTLPPPPPPPPPHRRFLQLLAVDATRKAPPGHYPMTLGACCSIVLISWRTLKARGCFRLWPA